MRVLIWGAAFRKSYKKLAKKRPDLRENMAAALKLLAQDPFLPQLETHKLKGKLSGSWACSAGYDLRIVFDFVRGEKGEDDDILLLAVGTHEEVY